MDDFQSDKQSESSPRKAFHPHYLFYSFSMDMLSNRKIRGPLPKGYSWMIWRPSLWQAWPSSSTMELKSRFLFRWVLLRLNIMHRPECGALLIYGERGLVHYSGFTAGYWRFPFMDHNDLQIGNTWTDPEHRGKGLALFGLQTLVENLSSPKRKLWYVVEAINTASIKVVERAAFTFTGDGTWIAPFGVKLMGAYHLTATRAIQERG